MSIRSLIVKIGADTQAIDKALAGVGSSSKNLAEGLKKLGDTPIGKQAQQDAERLQKSLESVNASLKRTADLGVNSAKGIEAIGGVSKLTSNQLSVMNRTVQDSIEAFRALGQEAPKELARISAAIQAQQKSLQTGLAPTTGGAHPFTGALGALPGGGVLSEFASGGSIAALAAGVTAGATAFTFATRAALDYADSLVKMSDKTGIGVVALQRLEAIAGPSGNTLEDLTGAVNQFQNRLISGQASDALRQLGIDLQTIRALNPDEQFVALANALQKVSDPAQQTRLAIELFGKAGVEVLPSLKANVDALKDSMTTLDAESVKALDDFGDELSKLKTESVRFFGEIAASAITTTKAILGLVDAAAHAVVPPAPPRTDQDLRERPQLANSRVGAPVARPALPLLESGPLTEALTNGTFANASRALIGLPAAASQALQSLEAVRTELLGQEAAAKAAGLSLEDYLKKIEDINEKIRQAQRPIADLTTKQLDQVIALRALGLTTEEVALKMGIGVNSILAFDKAMENQSQIFAKNADLSNKVQQAIGKLDLGYLKAADSARVLRQATLALTDAQAKQFDGADFLQARDTLVQFNKHLLNFGDITDRNTGIIQRNNDELDKEREKAERNAASIDDLARAFADMAQVGGGAFGGILRGLGQMVTGINLAKKAIHQMSDEFNSAGELIRKASFLDKLVGSASLIGAGLQIGETIIKGVQQALEHLELSRIGHDVGRDFGVAISQGTEEGIRATEKQLADTIRQQLINAGVPKQVAETIIQAKAFREAATGLNLPAIIADAGGLEAFGRGKAISSLHDLFSLVERGKLTVQQIGSTFENVFSQLVPDAISKTSRLVSAAFVELQQTALRFNIKSPALEQFRAGQIGGVQSGLSDFFSNGGTVQSQASATGISGAIAASFAELQRQGVPLLDILKQFEPIITAFQKQLQATGFSGGAAFDTILQSTDLLKDAVAGPALQSIQSIQQVLAGLANTGGLDAETFSGLTDQIGATFRSLVEQGKDGNQILKLMAPSLQTIFELQQRTGFAVDETTANLIAQARAQGLVGDQFKSAEERQVDGLTKIADILAAIATAFGVTLPDSAKSGANKVNDALDDIHPPDITIDIGFNVDKFPEFPPGTFDPGDINTGATGGRVTQSGIQHFASGGRVLPFLRHGSDTVPAMLTPGEIILNAAQQKNLANTLSSQSDVSGDVVMVCDGEVLGRISRRDILNNARAMREFRSLVKVAS